MSTIQSQPDALVACCPNQSAALIAHGEIESALMALAIRQVSCLWGRTVWRASLLCWCIDGGEPVRLLRAIDAVMKRYGLVFGLPAGEDTSIDSSAD